MPIVGQGGRRSSALDYPLACDSLKVAQQTPGRASFPSCLGLLEAGPASAWQTPSRAELLPYPCLEGPRVHGTDPASCTLPAPSIARGCKGKE